MSALDQFHAAENERAKRDALAFQQANAAQAARDREFVRLANLEGKKQQLRDEVELENFRTSLLPTLTAAPVALSPVVMPPAVIVPASDNIPIAAVVDDDTKPPASEAIFLLPHIPASPINDEWFQNEKETITGPDRRHEADAGGARGEILPQTLAEKDDEWFTRKKATRKKARRKARKPNSRPNSKPNSKAPKKTKRKKPRPKKGNLKWESPA